MCDVCRKVKFLNESVFMLLPEKEMQEILQKHIAVQFKGEQDSKAHRRARHSVEDPDYCAIVFFINMMIREALRRNLEPGGLIDDVSRAVSFHYGHSAARGLYKEMTGKEPQVPDAMDHNLGEKIETACGRA